MTMIAKKDGGDFTPCTAGTHHAVVVDVTPLQKRQTHYGMKENFRIVFETETFNPENKKRFCVWSQWLQLSLHEKSNLLRIVKGVLNRDLTKEEEEDGFDVESLLGRSTQLLISHEHDDGKVYARIGGFIPTDHQVIPSGEYKRVINRDQSTGGVVPPLPNDNPRTSFQGEEAWKGTILHVGKNKGEMVVDLSLEQVLALLNHWWPRVKTPTAQDQALYEALIKGRNLIDQLKY